MESKSKDNLVCPFCGSDAKLRKTGKQQLTIKCKKIFGCGFSYVQKSSTDLVWLEEAMIKRWNQQPQTFRKKVPA